MSITHKQNPSRYWLDKKRSEETKKKISMNRRGKSTGKNHWNWKGGLRYYRLFRGKAKWNDWRKSVFERDNYTCQSCGSKSCEFDGKVYLEPHHIFKIINLIKNNLTKHIYNVNNGITLCRKCHENTF